jgi:4-amino-4-deoxy-L-arabinose transferase-like glycosyltransferase
LSTDKTLIDWMYSAWHHDENSGLLSALSKPVFYFSIIVALIALLLEWRKAIVMRDIRQVSLAVILTAVFGVYSYVIAMFYIATHAGV